MATTPVAIIDRPGATLRGVCAKAAQRFERVRLREEDAPLLAALSPPAFVYLHGPRSPQSSSALRQRR